jgi:hypothetical protein
VGRNPPKGSGRGAGGDWGAGLPRGVEATIHLTITDEDPFAHFVVIEARVANDREL